jgi:uncharacterized membrane protein
LPLRSIEVITVIFLLIALAPLSIEGRRDPDTGIIRLLHLGKVWTTSRYPGPIFLAEPKIAWNPVPSYFTPDCVCHHATTYGQREVREMRTKLPRTRDDLLNHDVVLIDAMFALDMPPSLATWIVEGVEEEGLGFIMVDDEVTFSGRGLAPSWYLTPIGNILPVDDDPSYYGWNERFQLSPVLEDHPLFKGLDFNGIWLEANNRPLPRLGSTVIAEMSSENPWNFDRPAMVYWDLGPGRSLAYIHRWHSQSGNFYKWKYHPDFLCHVIYFAAQEGIPDDLGLVHDVRSKMVQVESDRVVLLSTMDLADKFGANVASIERELSEIHSSKREANRLYVDLEFTAAASHLDLLLGEIDSLVQETLELKDRAMIWIFAIQYMAITGTSMLAGFVIWSLMVRRRLYSEVGTTRYLDPMN